jgi:ribosomal protein L37AE/L43A
MVTEETKPICIFCQSPLTVRLANETHCNSCGKSFALDKNPVATIAQNRKARRSKESGWPSRQGET